MDILDVLERRYVHPIQSDSDPDIIATIDKTGVIQKTAGKTALTPGQNVSGYIFFQDLQVFNAAVKSVDVRSRPFHVRSFYHGYQTSYLCRLERDGDLINVSIWRE